MNKWRKPEDREKIKWMNERKNTVEEKEIIRNS